MAPTETKTRTPPAYHNLPSTPEEALAIEAKWDQKCPKDWLCFCKHPTGCKGGHGTFQANTLFGLQPRELQNWSINRIFRNCESQPAWRALLHLQVRNTARLMREGFYWSSENLEQQEHKINLNLKPNKIPKQLSKMIFAPAWGWTRHDHADWKHSRTYFISDNVPAKEWRGTLVVYGKKPSTVIEFDINAITPETVVWARAWNWRGNICYDTCGGQGARFNTLFNEMPLDGWWPWPKRPDDRNREEGKHSRFATKAKAALHRLRSKVCKWNTPINPNIKRIQRDSCSQQQGIGKTELKSKNEFARRGK